MQAINRKLWRELGRMRSHIAAITLVVAAGIAGTVASFATMDALQSARSTFYADSRFADLFCELKRAPLATAHRIRQIPGVQAVEARIQMEVALNLEGFSEPVVGRVHALPLDDEPALNHLCLRRGRMPLATHPDEVVVGEAFAVAHQLVPGESITAILNGRQRRLTIVGIVLSPEYVYQMRSLGSWPDERRFGVLWAGQDMLEAVFDMEGAFNVVAIRLGHGAVVNDVLAQVDVLLKPWGGLGATTRREQASDRMLSDELSQLRMQGNFVPLIFLGVAAFLLHLVMGRLVQTQREQIAVLKAFGYRNRTVIWHFLQLAWLMILPGLLLGILGGAWLANTLLDLYRNYFRFPHLSLVLDLRVIAGAVLLTVVTACVGVWASAREILRSAPAESMRPPSPLGYRHAWLERLMPASALSQLDRMILRNIERRPWRSASTIVGLSLAAAILVLGSFSEDALAHMLRVQFKRAMRDDVTLTFDRPLDQSVRYDLARLPGVRRVEGMRGVPVQLVNGQHHKRTAITGIEHESQLFHILDQKMREHLPPDQGLLLSQALAELLHVRPGDFLRVEVMVQHRPQRDILVVGTVDDLFGVNAFMSRSQLNALMDEGEMLSGAMLAADSDSIEALHAAVKNIPRIASVTVQKASIQSFETTVAANIRTFRLIQILIASATAFGVAYNAARITLSERSRELASLRILGFSQRDIAWVLFGELGVLLMIAIPCGLGLGYTLAFVAVHAFGSELYRLPLVLEPSTWGFAMLVILGVALISTVVIRRHLHRLDLLAVLKST